MSKVASRLKYVVGHNVTVHIVARRVQYTTAPTTGSSPESLREYTRQCVEAVRSVDGFTARWN